MYVFLVCLFLLLQLLSLSQSVTVWLSSPAVVWPWSPNLHWMLAPVRSCVCCSWQTTLLCLSATMCHERWEPFIASQTPTVWLICIHIETWYVFVICPISLSICDTVRTGVPCWSVPWHTGPDSCHDHRRVVDWTEQTGKNQTLQERQMWTWHACASAHFLPCKVIPMLSQEVHLLVCHSCCLPHKICVSSWPLSLSIGGEGEPSPRQTAQD